MADYNSQQGKFEELPFDVETAAPVKNFPFTSTGRLSVDRDGFPILHPQVDSAGSLPRATSPPVTSPASGPFNQAPDDRNIYSTPPRPKRSGQHPRTPDTISSRQDEEDRGAPDFKNVCKEQHEQGENKKSTSLPGGHHSDSSQTLVEESSIEGLKKQPWYFKTKSMAVATLLMLLVLIAILITTYVFISGEMNEDIVPATDRPSVSPTVSASPSYRPSSTPSHLPTSAPTRTPTSRPTRTPTSAPSRSPSSAPSGSPSTPPTSFPSTSPTVSFEVPIRDFLFQESDVSIEPTSPAVQKAVKWLVDEANTALSLVFPLDPKYLQRFGILVLYFSLVLNVEATNSDKVHLPNEFMRNQDECLWMGMQCDENGLVTEIKLSNLQLDGTLPVEWGFFPSLKSIDFSKNHLQGSIPEGIYDILGLEEVHLYKNRLTGTISSKIGNLWSLRSFHLSHNQLSGSIPPELKSSEDELRPLRSFNVHRNQMTGTIPSNMQLRQLYYVDLGRNHFSGTVPPDLGTESVRLRHLYLDHNNLEGTFPSEVVNAGDGRLRALSLNNNHFTGTFPDDHQLLNYMVELTIQNNNFVSMGTNTCLLDTFAGGELVEFKSDCSICQCGDTYLCQNCQT